MCFLPPSTGSGGIEHKDMSRLVKIQVLCLQLLNRTYNAKLRKAILEYAEAELISALGECTYNILPTAMYKYLRRKECGLTEIQYPHDWYHFPNARLTVKHGDIMTELHIDEGYYDRPNALAGHSTGIDPDSWNPLTTQKVCVHMKGDTTFTLYGDLIVILGLGKIHDRNGDPLDSTGDGRSVHHRKTLLRCRFRPKPSPIWGAVSNHSTSIRASSNLASPAIRSFRCCE